jgi:hypothetical protein
LDAADAFKFIISNYEDTEPAKKILRNMGWMSVVDADIGALLHHFLEGQKDITTRPKQDLRQHFSNWLQKRPINELTKISLTIQTNHARRGQGSG